MPSHSKERLAALGHGQLVGGLGGGAEQSSSILHDPDLKAERERVSNPTQRLPGSYAMDPECVRRRMGLPEREIHAGSALLARVRRRAHPLPSLPDTSPRHRVFLSYLERAEQFERTPVDRRIWSASGRSPSARTARLLFTCQLHRHEALQFEGPAAQQHVIDGPAQLGRQDAQGFSLPVLLFQASEELLPCRVAAQEQGRSFREGPL
jgi:hypothetical protein